MRAAERRELIEQAATSVFAERGYLGASIDEISRRAGVSAPVIYDHFESKLDLYRRLLERTRNELLEVWREHLFVEGPAEERIPKALEAWAAYIESRRVQTRMYFREAAHASSAFGARSSTGPSTNRCSRQTSSSSLRVRSSNRLYRSSFDSKWSYITGAETPARREISSIDAPR